MRRDCRWRNVLITKHIGILPWKMGVELSQKSEKRRQTLAPNSWSLHMAWGDHSPTNLSAQQQKWASFGETCGVYRYFSRILLVALFGGCYETALDRDRFVLEAHLPNEFLQVSSLDHVDSSEIFGDKFPDHRHHYQTAPNKRCKKSATPNQQGACSNRMSLSSSPCASQDMAVTERTACRERPNSLAESNTEIHRLVSDGPPVHWSTGGPLGGLNLDTDFTGAKESWAKTPKQNVTKKPWQSSNRAMFSMAQGIIRMQMVTSEGTANRQCNVSNQTISHPQLYQKWVPQ